MNEKTDNQSQEKQIYPASVVGILDHSTLVINRGAMHGIKLNQRFLIYSLSAEEIKDPSTGENLGYLEIVKGTGIVIHVQEKMATIASDMEKTGEKTIIRRKPVISSFDIASMFGGEQETIKIPNEEVPFNDPKIGDSAKPI
ncbi:MAG: hypothetical protein WC980_01620 [Candidatus Brocadiia bacterium]